MNLRDRVNDAFTNQHGQMEVNLVLLREVLLEAAALLDDVRDGKALPLAEEETTPPVEQGKEDPSDPPVLRSRTAAKIASGHRKQPRLP
jgi:hypothetical protein